MFIFVFYLSLSEIVIVTYVFSNCFFRRKCVERCYIIILIKCCCRQSAHTINRNAKITSGYTIVLSDVLCTTCLHVFFLQGLAISISVFRTANFDLNLVWDFALPSAWYKFERPLLEITLPNLRDPTFADSLELHLFNKQYSYIYIHAILYIFMCLYLDIDILYKHCLSIQYPHACIFGVSVFIQPFMKGGPPIRTRGAHCVVLKGYWMKQNVTTCQPYSEFHAGTVFSNFSSQYIFGNCLTYLWTNFSILFLRFCFQNISKHPQPHTPPAWRNEARWTHMESGMEWVGFEHRFSKHCMKGGSWTTDSIFVEGW